MSDKSPSIHLVSKINLFFRTNLNLGLNKFVMEKINSLTSNLPATEKSLLEQGKDSLFVESPAHPNSELISALDALPLPDFLLYLYITCAWCELVFES
ncbi:hypothetical protein [Myxosarcina sp. GI1(2024)]